MEHLIEVAFKGNRREFFRWAHEAPPPVRAPIIVEVERGEDLGRVHATGELAERRKAGTSHGKEQREPLRAALRLASDEDATRADVLRVEEETARRFAVQKARALNLQMKISDAEWQWDRRRLTFYFTAEERVDFRTLVRQLEGHFGVRVQMWHIGPRDEAKRLDGVGHCGRQLCSASWLPELLPVKTSLAKEQRLSTITPTQISGACGRLMCCLRYEHEFYVQARKRFPKQGKIVRTLQGEEKVDNTDIFRDLVTLRNPGGEVRTIPLAQFRRELAGDAMPVEDDVTDAADEAHEESERPVEAATPRQRAVDFVASLTRAEPRSDARGDVRRDRAAAATPRRDDRPPRPESAPTRDRPRADAPPESRPRADASRADAPRADTPRPDTPPTPAPRAEPPGANRAQSDPNGDAEQHRRRRRGRRGGRRHRGDRPPGAPGGNGNGGGAPPANPNT
ncbi:MAG: hypothetical protein H3C62_06570 [Gemmatimonadaceae bacterium]|nr:hypothetical protein [Gemmatimonadaceae bacterium]